MPRHLYKLCFYLQYLLTYALIPLLPVIFPLGHKTIIEYILSSYESKNSKCQPQAQTCMPVWPKRRFTTTIHWGQLQTHAYCLSCDFAWWAKLALEKKTSQVSLAMPLRIGSV